MTDIETEQWFIDLKAELDDRVPQAGDVWRHYKGDEYEIVAQALVEDSKQWAIVYRRADGTGPCWVRPANEFSDPIYLLGEIDWTETEGSSGRIPTECVTRFTRVRRGVRPTG